MKISFDGQSGIQLQISENTLNNWRDRNPIKSSMHKNKKGTAFIAKWRPCKQKKTAFIAKWRPCKQKKNKMYTKNAWRLVRNKGSKMFLNSQLGVQ